MNDTAREGPLGGRAFGARWDIDHHISFTFEVPADLVERALPAGVHAVEPVPGRALINLIHARYVAGTVGERAPFDEVVCSAIALPDLSVPMPTPKQTLCVLMVLSNSERFVRYKVPALRMPVRHEPGLRSEVSDAGRSVSLVDGRGPLFSLRSGEHAPTFRHREFFGQYFAFTEGALHHGVWSWRGEISETQRHKKGAGLIHPHPLFDELGLAGLDARDCFLQQVKHPTRVAHMHTYEPVTR